MRHAPDWPRRTGFLVGVLALAGLGAGCAEDPVPTAPTLPPVPEPPPMEERAPPPTFADQVVDRESLRLFVESAVNEVSLQVANADEVYAFLDRNFRPEGPWRHEEIYFFALRTDGFMFFHAVNPDLEETPQIDLQDSDGVRITEEILEVAGGGGGFVEYRWENPALEGDEDGGSPKVSYALPLTIGDLELVLGAGIYPPVTAADVRNRGTLQAFVERAAGTLADAASDLEAAYAFLDATFRPDGEWRFGEIYVFVIDADGVNFFQAPDPTIEGVDRSQAEDLNGVRIIQELLAAAEAGGGFVEYFWDNPAIEGDEETGSPKLAYAVPVSVGSISMVIGSGIYLDSPEP